MSFMVSESIKQRLDEKTFLSDCTPSESIKIAKQDLKQIKFFADSKTEIIFLCSDNAMEMFLQEKIKTIKFRSLCFKKLKLKQIVIEDSRCILKILCEEKEIENNQ